MALNSHVIKKNNKISFLICLNQTIKFYCQFGWRVMSKENFQFQITTLIKMECIIIFRS